MAFALPTTPCTSLLTYQEMDDMHYLVLGASAGLIGTTQGQVLARAADAAYWQIVNCLLRQGYTASQITLWFAAYGHSMHIWLAAYYWLSELGVARDHAVFADAARFREEWKTICEDGAPIFDVTGALIIPDTDRLGADLQARSSVQNNSLGANHNFRVDADPRQMLAGNASSIVGGSKYENPAGC